MVFGPFDYRPNVNIPPDVFSSLANRYSGALQAFQEPYEKASQRVKWQQAINQLMQSKDIPQQFKNFGPLMANNPDMAGPLIQEMMQVQTRKPTSPWRVVPNMISPNGKPIQQNEETGEVREAQLDLGVTPTGRGNAKFMALHTPGLNLKSPTDPAKSHYYEARAGQADISGLNLLEKSIDPGQMSRNTPIGAAASSVRRAINGVSLLSQPVVTKTALEATLGDLDSILTQASATVEGRRMLNTSTLRQNLAKYQSFVASAPDQVQSDPGLVKLYKDILLDLGPIAQKMVQNTVDQRANLYRAKAMGITNKDNYDALIQRVKDTYDIQKALGMSDQSEGLPSVGDTFQGGKVLKIEKVQ